MLTALTTRGAKLAPLGKSLEQVGEKADSLTTRIEEITKRLTVLGDRTKELEDVDHRIQALKESVHQAEATTLRALGPDGDCFWLEVDVPSALAPLMISKGSVAVDGISLTVAALRPAGIAVQIVPFTWSHTSLQEARAGDAVNLEGDVIGKYVARYLEAGHFSAPADSQLTIARLIEQGF